MRHYKGSYESRFKYRKKILVEIVQIKKGWIVKMAKVRSERKRRYLRDFDLDQRRMYVLWNKNVEIWNGEILTTVKISCTSHTHMYIDSIAVSLTCSIFTVMKQP